MWVLSITLGAGGFRREATVNNMAIYRSTPGQMVIPFQQHASEVFPSVCPSLHRPVLGGIALPVPLALAHALCGWVVVWCWCKLALLGSIGYPCNSSSKAKKLQDWRLMNCCKASLLNLRIFFWMIGDVWKSSIWYMGLYGVCFVQSAAVLLFWIESKVAGCFRNQRCDQTPTTTCISKTATVKICQHILMCTCMCRCIYVYIYSCIMYTVYTYTHTWIQMNTYAAYAVCSSIV